MSGYVVSALKPGAEPVLMSHLDDPVMAAWRFGLGRVAVYTADLRSPWSAGLRTWSGFSTLWLQTTRWVGRRATDRALRASLVEGPDGARLVVDAEGPSGESPNLLDVYAAVRGPSGGEQDVPLRATAPGRYETPLDTPSSGPYVASITARSSDGHADARALCGFYWSANRERRATGVDMAALAQIALATGGRVLGPNDNPFAGPRPRAYTDVWTELAAAALLLFLIDVALRRGLTIPHRRHRVQSATPSRAAA
jgi:hypothetical protein